MVLNFMNKKTGKSELKPFTKDWWWQLLLDHVYLCKWKYRNLEEMKSDSELTDFIISRIERKIKANVLSEHILSDDIMKEDIEWAQEMGNKREQEKRSGKKQ